MSTKVTITDGKREFTMTWGPGWLASQAKTETIRCMRRAADDPADPDFSLCSKLGRSKKTRVIVDCA